MALKRVAAAITVSTLIQEFNVTELIFTGVAGAIAPHLRIGDIILGKRLIQHDMDARPIMKQFEIPLLGNTFLECHEEQLNIASKAISYLLENKHLHSAIGEKDLEEFDIRTPQLVIGDIASGDKFFSNTADKNDLLAMIPSVLCVEMEGAAGAQVCYEHSIPLGVLRTISDRADSAAPIDFLEFTGRVAAIYSRGIIKNLIANRTGSRLQVLAGEAAD